MCAQRDAPIISRQVELESLEQRGKTIFSSTAFFFALLSSGFEFTGISLSRFVVPFSCFFFFLFFSFIYPEDAIVIMGGPIRDGTRRGRSKLL